MKNIKSHFKFNKQERSGIFFLLAIIVLLQLGYFFVSFFKMNTATNIFKVDVATQKQITNLKQESLAKDLVKIYPFNPNFITDYKGYVLGLSVEEIDRLQVFRLKNKYVNSPEEFQVVTLISDSLLNSIAPYFKFPEWTQKRNKNSVVKSTGGSRVKPSSVVTKFSRSEIIVKDINTVGAEELKLVSGVGEVLSKRIIKFRDKLGGFLVDDQLKDVYGLKPEVTAKVLLKYKVLTKPIIYKVNINTASAYEISKIVYINYKVAKEIIDVRQRVGFIKSFNELKEIEGFPSDEINRIELYLMIK